MKQASDWRDALSSLLGDALPDTSEPETTPNNATPRPRQNIRVDIERKGRGGKTATIISGFNLPDNEIADIASDLKKRLGVGGSARGGEILIQGERRDAVISALRQMGII